MNLKVMSFILSAPILLLSCNEDDRTESSLMAEKAVIRRNINPQQYTRGQKLFLRNCARCHGNNAEGTTNWQKPNQQGQYPAPPLNGTAHTWHHSTKVLSRVIKNGTKKQGGNMPGWKDKLTDKEINEILLWVQAQWPDEIYNAWYNNFHDTK